MYGFMMMEWKIRALIYFVFSFYKNVNEENVENIYNVAESQLTDKLMDAAIVDGIYVIEGE